MQLFWICMSGTEAPEVVTTLMGSEQQPTVSMVMPQQHTIHSRHLWNTPTQIQRL